MPERSPTSFTLVKVQDQETQRNFDTLHRAFTELCQIINGKIVADVTVTASGDFKVKPPMNNPKGILLIYSNNSVNYYSKGLDSDGFWVINAGVVGPTTMRFLFF